MPHSMPDLIWPTTSATQELLGEFWELPKTPPDDWKRGLVQVYSLKGMNVLWFLWHGNIVWLPAGLQLVWVCVWCVWLRKRKRKKDKESEREKGKGKEKEYVVYSRGLLTVIVWDGGGSCGSTQGQKGDSLTLPTFCALLRLCTNRDTFERESFPLSFGPHPHQIGLCHHQKQLFRNYI